MQFIQLAETLTATEGVHSRLKITEIISRLWLQLEQQEIWEVANLLQGQLYPPYESLDFGLSDKSMVKVLALLIIEQGGLTTTGVTVDLFGQADEESIETQVRKVYRQFGDWGETAQAIHRQLFASITDELTIDYVYQQLVLIAKISGKKSTYKKMEILTQLLTKVDAASAKIIIRVVLGKMRLGFSTKTILDSLSWAVRNNKGDSVFLEEIWQKKADVGLLAQSYLALQNEHAETRRRLLRDNYRLQVGVPVVPALCQRLNSSQEIINKMGRVVAEPKYDGMRIQVHIEKKDSEIKVAAFTRSLDNVTAMFPELVELARALPVSSVIVDSEAVGFRRGTMKMLPFQEMMSRRRKHGVDQMSQDIPIKFYIFDLLYCEGQEWIQQPLLQRKKKLAETISDTEWSQVTKYIVTDRADKLQSYHHQQLENGLEGMVAKWVNSMYQSGRKGWNWVKIKEEEGNKGKLNDTLDLVVMGVYRGKGRRHEVGIGALLVGLPDEKGQLVTISKIGTGFTDEQLKDFRQTVEELTVAEKPANYHVDKAMIPDVWLAEKLVVEIAADEITHSSFHTSHYGLRFPRLIQWRADKTSQQATRVQELASISINDLTSVDGEESDDESGDI